jgi:hypothetical protein
MRRLPTTLAITAVAAVALSLPLMAADALPWPWKAKTPPDPALVTLSHIDDVSATIKESQPPILSITVKAVAPKPNFSELQLTYRLGDPKDRIFSFDAQGRAPQEPNPDVETKVTIEADYADAPIGNFDLIEVYSKDNCVAYSVKDNKPAKCTGEASPQ